MADTPSELYEKYLYNNTQGEIAYEVISISHSQITETVYCCKEPNGITVAIDSESIDCEGINFEVSRETSTDDLDVQFAFVFADNEYRLRDEADLIDLDTTEDIVVNYYIFMSSDMSEPAYGPIKLYADKLTATTDQTVTIHASAPSLVVNRCGELYTYNRFPMLKAYL